MQALPNMAYDVSKLKIALVDEAKLISPEVFDDQWSATQDLATFVSRILKQKLIAKPVLNDYLLKLYNVKYVNLASILIPPDILQKIPKEFSVEQEVLAFGLNGPKLQIAMVDPSNIYAIEYVRKKTGQDLEIYLTDLASFQSVIKGYKSDIQNLFSDVIREDSSSVREHTDLKDLAEGVPITKAANAIIEFAVSEGASDIHIELTEDELLIRFRVDGILHDMLMMLKSIHPLLVARIKIMADLKIDEHRLPQDGRITMKVNDLPISLRVSVLPTNHGEKVVIRILDESAKDLGLKDLGFAGRELEALDRAIEAPDGMILVTGPTGSGKTTTLYTAMRILNRPEVNINTIEDPIEYNMPRINQTQVNPAIDLTFANGLRSLLRQDPDIIMVGEIRDHETAGMAIHSSMTGHLVLSTLHTNDAPGAIPRFLDMDTEPFLLASTLKLVVAQRLVRKLCNDCKQPGKLDRAAAKIITQQLTELGIDKSVVQEWLSIPVHKPVGCARCGNSGYKGRMGIYEVLEITDVVKEKILDKVPGSEIRAEMIKQGHMPMFMNGLLRIKEGLTTLEEVMRVAQE